MSAKFVKKPLSTSKKITLGIASFGVVGSLGLIMFGRWLFGPSLQKYKLKKQIAYIQELERQSQETRNIAIDDSKLNDRYRTVGVELK